MIEIRRLTLYFLAIFSDSGTPRVWCYNNFQECLDAFCLYKDSSLFPYTFTKEIYITTGHPLFKYGEPIKLNQHLKNA